MSVVSGLDGGTVLADFASRAAKAKASEETMLGVTAGAGGAETEVVDYPPTGAELAWSHEEPETGVLPKSWGQAWSAAAVVLLIGVVVGIAIWAAALFRSGEPAPPAFAVPSSGLPPISSEPIQTPVAAPAPVVPVPTKTIAAPTQTVTKTVAAPPTAEPLQPPQDDLFVQRLKAHQIIVYNRAQVIAGAHWVCGLMRTGTTLDTVNAVQTRDPALTDQGAVDFVAASIDIYCPQYG